MVRVFDSIFRRKRRPYGCVGYAGSPATLRNQAVDRGVLAVFVAVVTICFVSAALRHRLNRPPFAEEAAIAIHLANGDGFSSPYDASHRAPPTSISAPVYPLIMAAAYRLGGISHVVLLLLAINAVCFGVIVCGVFHLGRYYVSPVSGWMAGMLLVVHPVLLYFVTDWWDSYLSLAIFVVLIVSAVEARKTANVRRACSFMGATMGALSLTNPSYALSYPLLILTALGGRSRRARAGAPGPLC